MTTSTPQSVLLFSYGTLQGVLLKSGVDAWVYVQA